MNRIVRFGPFEADLTSGELRRDGAPVPVQDLPFRVLAALVERPGALVTRAELSASLWKSDTFVDATAGLNTAVAKLREALGDSADRPTFIETIPKRGYRFIQRVELVAQGSSPALSDVAQGFSPAPSDVAQGFSPAPSDVAQGFSPASARRTPAPHKLIWTAAAALVFIGTLFAAFQLRADRPRTRVAVVLFDNETGRTEAARLAQNLTDAAVTELATDNRLAVIGNAAVLRTERPFRDIAKIRDAVNADYIVIGQVQAVDGRTIVRTHLIRAADQSHLTVKVFTLTAAGEAALQDEVARGVKSSLASATHDAR
jgi:DNA-binding winged helix-turn-helix (wHTH) protein/TolB-like protein